MKIDQEFVVGRSRDDVVDSLDRDDTFAALFPDTSVHSLGEHSRETRTPYPGPGRARDIRFVFQTASDGNVRFEKICDGNIWRSLEGEVRAERVDDRMTRVVLTMEGRTRAFVPELTIRAPMREQIVQMAKSLRSLLETD
ncbi:MAG: hypothetical protein JRG76_00110 [Deltaproteobacteria bacterium]|jgi:hypothetical protein|nr:hypothetical protein [Deltaproteobacteria bacterium]MBW2412882.1 hypothetical protein [Deltaproteobacteria bacterium]